MVKELLASDIDKAHADGLVATHWQIRACQSKSAITVVIMARWTVIFGNTYKDDKS